MTTNPYTQDRFFRWTVIAFLGTIGFSLVGMLLLYIPPVTAFFAPVLSWLIKIPTWIYMLLMPITVWLLYLPHLGLRKSLFFLAWAVFVGTIMELLGTATGFPFGKYFYTDLLGPKIMDLVPYFIPPAWYAMGLLSFDLATRLGHTGMQRVLTSSLFMVLWDFSLDPAMSYAQTFWVFPEGGFFFGMPPENWLGWFVSALIIMLGFEYLGRGIHPTLTPWVPRLWFLNAAFPFLVSLVSLKIAAFWFGLFASILPLLAVWAYEHSSTLKEPDIS